MSVGSQATNSCISYQILIRRATVNFLPDNIALFAPQSRESPPHNTWEFLFMDSDHIQISDRNWSEPGIVAATVLTCQFYTRYGSQIQKKIANDAFWERKVFEGEKKTWWRMAWERRQKKTSFPCSSDLGTAFSNSDLEQREFDKHRLPWPGLTVPVRRVVLQWSQNWIQVANIGPREFIISCKRNPAMTIHDLASPNRTHWLFIGLNQSGKTLQ